MILGQLGMPLMGKICPSPRVLDNRARCFDFLRHTRVKKTVHWQHSYRFGYHGLYSVQPTMTSDPWFSRWRSYMATGSAFALAGPALACLYKGLGQRDCWMAVNCSLALPLFGGWRFIFTLMGRILEEPIARVWLLLEILLFGRNFDEDRAHNLFRRLSGVGDSEEDEDYDKRSVSSSKRRPKGRKQVVASSRKEVPPVSFPLSLDISSFYFGDRASDFFSARAPSTETVQISSSSKHPKLLRKKPGEGTEAVEEPHGDCTSLDSARGLAYSRGLSFSIGPLRGGGPRRLLLRKLLRTRGGSIRGCSAPSQPLRELRSRRTQPYRLPRLLDFRRTRRSSLLLSYVEGLMLQAWKDKIAPRMVSPVQKARQTFAGRRRVHHRSLARWRIQLERRQVAFPGIERSVVRESLGILSSKLEDAEITLSEVVKSFRKLRMMKRMPVNAFELAKEQLQSAETKVVYLTTQAEADPGEPHGT
ncbi:hypothetical protein H6P81_001927 [Aristolochia fimbriata]|uniref:Uncharacterized protein n=1 Tax=Aristolochia fimbriata TaxID=158543 RepID=A0AAV7F9Z9_ARIFI|nr:hypothetical protein H6P81_001927 [Aristolochia fimbriata]